MKKVTQDGKIIGLLDEPNNHFTDKDIAKLNNFKVIQGGGGSSGGVNWLEDMPEDTTFICELKNGQNPQQGNPPFVCLTLRVDHKTARTTILIDALTDQLFARVNNVRFCAAMQLVEVLFDPRVDKQEGGNDEPPGNVE